MTIWNFKRNAVRAAEGAKLVLGVLEDGTEIFARIKRVHASNKEFANDSKSRQRGMQKMLEAMTDEQRNEKLGELAEDSFAATCIVSWNGFTDENGAELKCDADGIQFIRTNLPELFDTMLEFGTQAKHFIGSFNEDDEVKN